MPSSGICDLTVFSHRGLSGDKAVDKPLLTEHALVSLSGKGIRHFDLDLSFTSDDVLLVAHPAAVFQEIGKGHDVFAESLASLQNAAGALHPPLLQATRLLDLVAQHNLTVALDLKGADVRPKQHAAHLLSLAHRAVREEMHGRVWLWADTAEIARTLRRDLRRRINDSDQTRQQNMNWLTLVKPVRDRGIAPSRLSSVWSAIAGTSAAIDCSSSQLSLADVRLFNMLGPSLRCANDNLLAAPWARPRWGVGGSWSREDDRTSWNFKPPVVATASAISRVASVVGSTPYLPWMHPYTPHHFRPSAPLGAVFEKRHRASTQAGLLVWVVDKDAELLPLLKLGVRNVISNEPLRLRAAVQRMCKGDRALVHGSSTVR